MKKTTKTYIGLYSVSVILIVLGIFYFLIDCRNNSFVSNILISIGVSLVTGAIVGGLVSHANKIDSINKNNEGIKRNEKLISKIIFQCTFSILKIFNDDFRGDKYQTFKKVFGVFASKCRSKGVPAVKEETQNTCSELIDTYFSELKAIIENYLEYLEDEEKKISIRQSLQKIEKILEVSNLKFKICSINTVMHFLAVIPVVNDIFNKTLYQCNLEIKQSYYS